MASELEELRERCAKVCETFAADNYSGEWDSRDWSEMCADAIRALPLPTLATQWISVKERLPDNGEDVVLRFDNPLGGDAYRTGILVGVKEKMWHMPHLEHEITGKPTHWMPLPQPPKERV